MAISKAVVATRTVQTTLFAFDGIGWLIMSAIVSLIFKRAVLHQPQDSFVETTQLIKLLES